MTGNLPPGWYPDQTDPSQLRWWNGTAWSEGVQQPGAAASAGTALPRTDAAAYPPVAPSTPPVIADKGGAVGWMKRHKILTGIGAFVLVGALGNAVGEDTPTEPASDVKALADGTAKSDTNTSSEDVAAAADTSPSAKPQPKPKPTNPYGPQPTQQTQFLDIASNAKDQYASASNDLKAGAALSARNDAMCQLLGSGQVAGWTGTVTTLDSNGDGYGIVTIEMADNVELGTWNNAFSDIMDDTLVKPGPLLDKLLNLEEGQNVRFSGSFRPSSDTCVNDSRLTQAGSVDDPSFIFRFADVNKL
ncbi:DUF2510 domain-containing protein [Nocardioides glacieisoli]|uniref:DUF2510 domain-containing protein n=1 Tax=Nocardioides glacieisoli TaxID=1168730 RepID=A0A4Q2RIG1_9ACTN|nr:DUF2510 domain-containing protein [Nocardioides glacieisoli]RYB88490.1 DUF2510 domain-containing protein [Nocardioides glacieisoli]